MKLNTRKNSDDITKIKCALNRPTSTDGNVFTLLVTCTHKYTLRKRQIKMQLKYSVLQ